MATKLAIADAAWLAGYIDGDGSIGLYRNNGKRASRTPVLVIDSCDHEILGFVVGLVGGSVVTKPRSKSHHRQAMTWRLRGPRKVIPVLRQILPFMRCAFKLERARLLIEEFNLCTVPNGMYSPARKANKRDFEASFMALGSNRGSRAAEPLTRPRAEQAPERHSGDSVSITDVLAIKMLRFLLSECVYPTEDADTLRGCRHVAEASLQRLEIE